MFKVRELPTENKCLNPALSGVRFGFLDAPLRFSISTEKGEQYTLTFTVKIDPSKPRWKYEDVFDNVKKTFDIVFFNPSIPGTSGMTAPRGTLWMESGHLLGFVCWVDFLEGTENFRLTYSFYDDYEPPREKEVSS